MGCLLYTSHFHLPELIPADENGDIKQKTEDLVGPYELHDFFLYYFMRFGFRPSKIFMLASLAFKEVYYEETIKKWLLIFFRRFFNQQFKRSCLPDGPKVDVYKRQPYNHEYNYPLRDEWQ